MIPGHPVWQRDTYHKHFRPILGAGIRRDMSIEEFFSFVHFPVIVTPKFDGIRCITVPGLFESGQPALSVPVCRSLDIVPNQWIQQQLGLSCIPGLDGEIMTYEAGDLLDHTDRPRAFHKISSDVMSQMGRPLFKFHVFDFHDFKDPYPHLIEYEKRLEKLSKLELPKFCVHVPNKICFTIREIETFEEEMVAAGYEGICWRNAHSPYKYGRSTLKQQFLIKMKRFETAEATITGTYEERHNANTAEANNLGYKERSTHQANMVGKNRLGGLQCTCPLFEQSFNIGSGFTSSDREELWRDRVGIIGKLVTFKFQRHGTKDRPRIPIFVGFRDKRDL